MLGERRASGRGLGSLALLFGEREEVTGTVTELGSETGTLSPSMSTHTGRGVGRWGGQGAEQGEGPGSSFDLQSQKDCFAPSR